MFYIQGCDTRKEVFVVLSVVYPVWWPGGRCQCDGVGTISNVDTDGCSVTPFQLLLLLLQPAHCHLPLTSHTWTHINTTLSSDWDWEKSFTFLESKYTISSAEHIRSPLKEPHLAWGGVFWWLQTSLLSLFHVLLGWSFNMLVSDLAGVNWLWPFMLLSQIYGISNLAINLANRASSQKLWPKFEWP